MRFSVRSLLLVIALFAMILALAIPLNRYMSIPTLYLGSEVRVMSNTKLPVVSVNVVSASHTDQPRILLLLRQTKYWSDITWLPEWFEPHRSPDGVRLRGKPVNSVMDVWALYPRSDSDLTVVYASDEEDPKFISLPYSKYAETPWRSGEHPDGNMLWEHLLREHQ